VFFDKRCHHLLEQLTPLVEILKLIATAARGRQKNRVTRSTVPPRP